MFGKERVFCCKSNKDVFVLFRSQKSGVTKAPNCEAFFTIYLQSMYAHRKTLLFSPFQGEMVNRVVLQKNIKRMAWLSKGT